MPESTIDRVMQRATSAEVDADGVQTEQKDDPVLDRVGPRAQLEPGPNVTTSGWLAEARSGGGQALEERARVAQLKLGEIMVMLGLLAAADRDKVLERQEKLRLPFGECCVRLRLIKPKDLSRALAWQFGDRHPDTRTKPFSKELAVVMDPFGAYAQALREIGVKLMSRWVKEGNKAIAVVSGAAAEGRSHVVANLAASLALSGWRTLLVDADFHRPRQHIIFNLPQHPGLSRLLCGFAPRDVIRHVSGLTELTVVTSGPLPPNAVELFTRNDFAAFLQQARAYYDVLLIDTPSLGEFTDTELIASAAGSALIVVRKNQSREKNVSKWAQTLTLQGVEIAGTLMNEY